jgi:hypothetical protein
MHRRVISKLTQAFLANPEGTTRVNAMKQAILRSLDSGREYDYERAVFNHNPRL